jgi:hypothetical protein
MGWISIKDQLPPNDDTKIFAWDRVYGISDFSEKSFVTLQHINCDIRDFGESRVSHWAYANDSDLSILFDGDKGEDKVNTKKSSERQTQRGEWTSNNGKWTVKKTGNTEGVLIDNNSGKHYLWSLKDEKIKVIGIKLPKYIEKKIWEFLKK